MSRPRNEPSWCVKTDHDDSEVGIHVSRQLRVGDRYHDRGEVMVCLQRGGDNGETRMLLVAAHMGSMTADLSLEQARGLRDHLDVLLRVAENADRS